MLDNCSSVSSSPDVYQMLDVKIGLSGHWALAWPDAMERMTLQQAQDDPKAAARLALDPHHSAAG